MTEIQQTSNLFQQTEYLSMAEAAQAMSISVDGMRALVKRNREFLTEYVSKQIHTCKVSGLTRHMTVITKQGLVILANLKDGARNYNGKKEVKERFSEGKVRLAETAIAAATPSSDPMIMQFQQMIVLRQEFLSQQSQISEIKQELAEVKQLQLQAPPIELVTSQREFLNDRVRYYCLQTEMSHSYVWKKLHTYMDRDSINDYKFGDFKPAIRYLKEMYRTNHIEWN